MRLQLRLMFQIIIPLHPADFTLLSWMISVLSRRLTVKHAQQCTISCAIMLFAVSGVEIIAPPLSNSTGGACSDMLAADDRATNVL